MTGHILDIGETQSGKTVKGNELHQADPPGLKCISVFFNTNHASNIWGAKARSVPEMVNLIKAGNTKINYIPHRGMEKADWLRTRQELRGVMGFFEAHWDDQSTRAGRLVVDEAQNFKEELQHAATMFLGKGVQVIAITQYPVMVDTTSRSNMPTWIIFKTGFQMEKFFQGFGKLFPKEAIMAWTANKYHYVSYHPDFGWRRHCPRGCKQHPT